MKTITGLFDYPVTVSHVIAALEEAGIERKRIGLVMTPKARDAIYDIEEGNKAAEGGATGALLGGALGALAAGLTAVGTVVLPGVGFLAVGPIAAALAGAGAGGAVGGFFGGLIGLGIPDYEAKLYEEHLVGGSIMVAVETHGKDEEGAVARTFAQYNAKKAA